MPRPSSAVALAAVLMAAAPAALAQTHGGGHGHVGGGGIHGGGLHGGVGVHGGGLRGSGYRGGGVHGGGVRGGGSHYSFRGRDFGHLSPGLRSHWAGGQWRHAWHDGVFGWWWFLDDDWYFYDEPTYPYPTYIAPEVDEGSEAPPPAVWYRCANPPGYYPYVRACPDGWEMVPAVPPDAEPGSPGEPQPPPPQQQ